MDRRAHRQISRVFFAPLLAVLILLGGTGCIEALDGKVCTERGCGNGASITLRRSDWTTPPLALELEVDGRRVSCPAPPARNSGGQPCSEAGIHVAHVELADCVETRTVSYACTPNGKLTQVIRFVGTPQRIVVTVKTGAESPPERAFDIAYQSVRPNGEGCEPVCLQAAEMWELP